MELTEKTLSRRDIFEGKVVSLHVDTVELPDGTTSIREVVEHVDGVAVLALDEDDTVYLVRQFRYALGQELWELPAGKLEAGEDPFEAAQRELEQAEEDYIQAQIAAQDEYFQGMTEEEAELALHVTPYEAIRRIR